MAAPDAKSGAPDPNPVYDFTRARDTAVGEKFAYVNLRNLSARLKHLVGAMRQARSTWWRKFALFNEWRFL
jgi:hypothetical protein